MNKLFYTLPLIIFFLLIIIFSYFLITQRDPSKIPSVLINKNAPSFNAKTLFNNNPFEFNKAFNNKTIVLNFFASWCIPCQLEHSYISEIAKNNNIKVIGVNYKDSSKDAIKWLNKFGNPYSEIIVDPNGLIAIEWGVYGIPETFIINKKKIIIYKQVGPINSETYNDFKKKLELVMHD